MCEDVAGHDRPQPAVSPQEHPTAVLPCCDDSTGNLDLARLGPQTKRIHGCRTSAIDRNPMEAEHDNQTNKTFMESVHNDRFPGTEETVRQDLRSFSIIACPNAVLS
ncbi:hypothetical protein JCM19992_13480 [Thermostilla marina]